MSGTIVNLVEIDRGQVTKMGGTLYIKIPPAMRKKDNIKFKDTIIFSKAPDGTIVIEKEKNTK